MSPLMKKSALYTLLVVAGAGAAWIFMTINRGDAAVSASAPTAAGQGTFGGPTIAGLCVLDRQRVFNTSKVGKEANDRYRQMRTDAQTTVSGEEAKIVGEAKALQGQKASLPPAQFQQRIAEINQRYQALRGDATKRSQALEVTRQQAVGQISQAVQPIIVAVYKNRRCGVLVDQASILAGNPAMNVTDAVIASLDAKVTSIAVPAQADAAKHM
jgi:Skp family chaperone for outer membrane proteins